MKKLEFSNREAKKWRRVANNELAENRLSGNKFVLARHVSRFASEEGSLKCRICGFCLIGQIFRAFRW